MPQSAPYDDGLCSIITSIATANARFTVPQIDAAEFMLRTDGLSEALRKRIPQVYARSGIDQRHTVLEDYTREFARFEFYPRSRSLKPSPTTGARNRIFQQESVPLATQAAKGCLESAAIAPEEITHLIVVTCTGFFAPGLDIQIAKGLGLPATTQRTVIGFVGCHAAFNALRLADSICKSDDRATVLIVCVELCTLHFQIEDSLESVVVNALFSDGAAAAIMTIANRSENAGKLIYRDHHSLLHEGSLDAMSWAIGDTGFLMGLSPKVPEIIAGTLPAFVEELLRRNDLRTDDVSFWAVHPGGRKVLDRTGSIMALQPEQIADSYDVLREHGNMSSPTILFILQKIIDRQEGPINSHVTHPNYGVALAFGPGLTIEGCLLEVA